MISLLSVVSDTARQQQVDTISGQSRGQLLRTLGILILMWLISPILGAIQGAVFSLAADGGRLSAVLDALWEKRSG